MAKYLQEIFYTGLGSMNAASTSGNGNIVFNGRAHEIYIQGDTFKGTDTTYSAGGGLVQTGTEFSHKAGNGVAQSTWYNRVQVDQWGHVVSADTNDEDTHWTSYIYAGSNTGAANQDAASNPYLKLFENGELRSLIRLVGGSGIGISSDTNGNVTFVNTLTDTWRPIIVGGNTILDSSSGGSALTLKAGENVQLAANGAEVTISATDTVYTLPHATTGALGGVKLGYQQTNKNYPLLLDANDKAYVTVDWTDTDTWRPVTVNGTNIPAGQGLVLVPGSNISMSVNGSTYEVTVNNTYTYTLPAATSAALGGFKTGFPVNDAARNYPVALNTSNQAYVNVPWSDTNTWRPVKVNGTAVDASVEMRWTAGSGILITKSAGSGYEAYEIANTYSYTLPVATSSTLGGVMLGYTTDAANKNYAVTKDASGNIYVNVPWVNTWRSVSAVNSSNTEVTINSDVALKLKSGTNMNVSANANGEITFNNTYSYSLPLAASGTRGGIRIGFTTDNDSRKYAVELDSEKAYVNVPWTDTWRPVSVKQGTSVTAVDTSAPFGIKGGDNINVTVETDGGVKYAKISGTYAYSLPHATPGALGGIKTGFDTSAAARNYAVQLDANDKAYVNVPWADTDTWRPVVVKNSAGTEYSIQKSADSSLKLIAGTNINITPVNTSNLGLGFTVDNTYTLPVATSGALGGIKIGFSTNAANRNYAVLLSNQQAYVNVPWTDTHYTTTLAVGAQSATSSSSVSNPWLTVIDDTTARTSLQLTGSQSMYVDSDAAGNVYFSITAFDSVVNGTQDGIVQFTGPNTTYTLDARHTHSFQDLSDIPTEFTPASHNHSAEDIVEGKLDPARIRLEYVANGVNVPVKADSTGLYVQQTDAFPHDMTLAVGNNDGTMSGAIVLNPYLKLFDNNQRKGLVRFVGDDGVYVESGADGSVNLSVVAVNNFGNGTSDGMLNAYGPYADFQLDFRHTHRFADLAEIPATFTPAAHNHSAAEITSGILSANRLPLNHIQSGNYYPVRADLDGQLYADVNISAAVISDSISAYSLDILNTGGSKLYSFDALGGIGQIQLGTNMTGNATSDRIVINSRWDLVSTAGSGVVPSIPIAGAAGTEIASQSAHWVLAAEPGGTSQWMLLPSTAFTPAGWTLKKGSTTWSVTSARTVQLGDGLTFSTSRSTATLSPDMSTFPTVGSSKGIVPAVTSAGSAIAANTELVLVSSGANQTPVWKPLPSTAFGANPVSNVLSFQNGSGSGVGSFTANGDNFTVKFAGSLSSSLSGSVLTVTGAAIPATVTSSAAGIVPKIAKSTASWNESNDWVLVSNNGGTPAWRPLPAGAYNTATGGISTVYPLSVTYGGSTTKSYNPGSASSELQSVTFGSGLSGTLSGTGLTVSVNIGDPTSSAKGLVPALSKNTAAMASSDWFLVSANGGAPVWRQIPATALSNTTYQFANLTVSGKNSGNTAVSMAYTPGGTSAQTAKTLEFDPGSMTVTSGTNKVTVAAKLPGTVSTAAAGLAPQLRSSSNTTKISNGMYVLAQSATGNDVNWYQLPDTAYTGGGGASVVGRTLTFAQGANSYVFNPVDGNSKTVTIGAGLTLGKTGNDAYTLGGATATTSAVGMIPATVAVTSSTPAMTAQNNQAVLVSNTSGVMSWMRLHANAFTDSNTTYKFNSMTIGGTLANGSAASVAYTPGIASSAAQTPYTLTFGGGLVTSISNQAITVNSKWDQVTGSAAGIVPQIAGGSKLTQTDNTAWVLTATGSDHSTVGWRALPDTAWSAAGSGEQQSVTSVAFNFLSNAGTTLLSYDPINDTQVKSLKFGPNITTGSVGSDGILTIDSVWQNVTNSQPGYVKKTGDRSSTRITDSYYVLAHTGTNEPNWFRMPSNAFSNTTYSFANLTVSGTNSGGTTSSVVFTPGGTSAPTAKTVTFGSNMTVALDSNMLAVNSKWDAAAYTTAGYIPAANTRTDTRVTDSYYILAQTGEGAPNWLKLPSNAFSDTTYTFGTLTMKKGSTSLVFTPNSTSRTLELGGNMTGSVSSNTFTINSKWDSVSSSAAGIVPAIANAGGLAISSQTDDWVLVSAAGAAPAWKRLPATAFSAGGSGTGVVSRLYFQNNGGSNIDSFDPSVAANKTLKAGSNVTMTASDNVITIQSKWSNVAASAAGIVPSFNTKGSKAIDSSTADYVLTVNGSTVNWRLLPKAAFIETTGGGAGDLTAVLTYKDVNGSLQTYNPASGTDVDISAGIWYARNAGDAVTWNGKDQSWIIQTLSDLTVSPTSQTGLLIENGTGTGKVTVLQNGAGTATASQLKLRQDSSYLEWRNATGGTWSAWTKIKAGYADSAGSSASASQLSANRTITLTGAVTGSVSTNLGGNVSIATSYAKTPVNVSDTALQSMAGPLLATLLKSGAAGSAHVDVSANAVQAWNNTSTAALYLNPRGGDVYVGSNKVLTSSYAPTAFASGVTRGGTRKPVWISSGTVTEFTGNTGGVNQPVYISGGVLTAGNSYVPVTGGTFSGDITVLNADATATRVTVSNTTANSGAQLWMWAGANGTANIWFSNLAGITSKSIVAVDAAGNATFNGTASVASSATTATTAVKLSAGAGSNTQPIYIASDGTPTASTANVGGNANTPVRFVNGIITACNSFVPVGGGTFTGGVTSTNVNGFTVSSAAANNEPKFRLVAPDGSVGLIIGGSSRNKGLYDYGKSKWIVYSDSNGNVVLNGNATGTAAGIAGGAAGSLPYQSAAGTTVFLAATATNGAVLKYNTSTKAPYWATDSNTVNTAGATTSNDASLWIIGAKTATSNTSEQTYKDPSISIKGANLTTAGTITAGTFTGNLSGNATSATTATTASKLGTNTVGGTRKPFYLAAGVPTAWTGNTGGVNQPVYISNGELVAGNVFIPSTGGFFTGSMGVKKGDNYMGFNGSESSNEMWLYHISPDHTGGKQIINVKLNGTATFYGNLEGNATSATTATKLGSGTVGGNRTPFYLNSGVPTAWTGNTGGSNTPVYVSGGAITAGNEYVPKTGGTFSGDITVSKGSSDHSRVTVTNSGASGVGTMSLWMWGGTNGHGCMYYSNASSGGSRAIFDAYGTSTTFYGNLSGNAASASKIGSSTVGDNRKPVYLNAGTPTAFSGNTGGVNQPVYISGGSLTAGNSFVPTGGGTFTGNIYNSSNANYSWIAGTNNARFTVSGQPASTASYVPGFSQRSYDGWWTFGVYNGNISGTADNNIFWLTYCTEANRAANNNATGTQFAFGTDGTFRCARVTGKADSAKTADSAATATTAGAWTTARTLTVSGDASGSVSVKGNANMTLSLSVNKLGGMSLCSPNTSIFGGIPYVGNDGVMETGRYIDLHYDSQNTDYSHRIQTSNSSGTSRYTLTLPNASGTVALTSDISNATNGFITKSGDSGVGRLSFNSSMYRDSNYANGALHLNNGDITGVNALVFNDYADDWSEGIIFKRSSSGVDSLYVQDGTARIYKNGTSYVILDSNNAGSYAVTNAAASGNYLRIYGPFTNGYKDITVPYASSANYASSASSADIADYLSTVSKSGAIPSAGSSTIGYVYASGSTVYGAGMQIVNGSGKGATIYASADGLRVYSHSTSTSFDYTLKAPSWSNLTGIPTAVQTLITNGYPSATTVDYTKVNPTYSTSYGGYILFTTGYGSNQTVYCSSGLKYDPSTGMTVNRLDAATLLYNGSTVATQTYVTARDQFIKPVTRSSGTNYYLIGVGGSGGGYVKTAYQSSDVYFDYSSSAGGGLNANNVCVSPLGGGYCNIGYDGNLNCSLTANFSGTTYFTNDVYINSSKNLRLSGGSIYLRNSSGTTMGYISADSDGVNINDGLYCNGDFKMDDSATAYFSYAEFSDTIKAYIPSNTSTMYVVGTTAQPGNSGYLKGHSSFYFTSSGAYHTSDRRSKENITDVREDILRVLDGPTGLAREFDLKESGEHKIGYIAQEVLEIIPEAVNYDGNSDRYAVDYNTANVAMIAALTMKVKRQDAKIEEQDAKIEEQAAEIRTLRDEMAEMRKMLMKLMTAED